MTTYISVHFTKILHNGFLQYWGILICRRLNRGGRWWFHTYFRCLLCLYSMVTKKWHKVVRSPSALGSMPRCGCPRDMYGNSAVWSQGTESPVQDALTCVHHPINRRMNADDGGADHNWGRLHGPSRRQAAISWTGLAGFLVAWAHHRASSASNIFYL